LLAEELGAYIVFIEEGPPYLRNWFKTGRELERLKPRIVLVQLPQGPLLYLALRLAKRYGFHVVADVHTGFVHPASLAEKLLNGPFRRLLRQCSLVLAQGEASREYLVAKGFSHSDNTITVYDPVGRPLVEMEPYEYVEPGSYILVPASWTHDEPLDFIVREYAEFKVHEKWGYKLVITGNYRRRAGLARRIMGVNGVVLTGFVSDAVYHWLIANAALVIAATTRKCTALMRAIWDAALYETPVVMSWTKTLEKEITTPCFFRYVNGGLGTVLEACLENEEYRYLTKLALRELKKRSAKTLEDLKARLMELLKY